MAEAPADLECRDTRLSGHLYRVFSFRPAEDVTYIPPGAATSEDFAQVWGIENLTTGMSEAAGRVIQTEDSPISGATVRVDWPTLRESDARAFFDRIRDHLDQDVEDAADAGERAPSKAVRETCLSLARYVARIAVLDPLLKAAAFSEDDGGIAFVLQSLVTDRRLDFRLHENGDQIKAIMIDENMKSTSVEFAPDDTDRARELTEWVTRRA